MKLKQDVIAELKKAKRARARLQLELNKSEYTINKYIADNAFNGDLTKATALKIITEETGIVELLENFPEGVEAHIS